MDGAYHKPYQPDSWILIRWHNIQTIVSALFYFFFLHMKTLTANFSYIYMQYKSVFPTKKGKKWFDSQNLLLCKEHAVWLYAFSHTLSYACLCLLILFNMCELSIFACESLFLSSSLRLTCQPLNLSLYCTLICPSGRERGRLGRVVLFLSSHLCAAHQGFAYFTRLQTQPLCPQDGAPSGPVWARVSGCKGCVCISVCVWERERKRGDWRLSFVSLL